MILCVGTTPVFQRTMTFQRLRLDEVNRAVEVAEYASGKAINVARVAHTLGEDVIVTGFVGGATGTSIRGELSAGGIAHDFVDVQPATRTCVTVIDRTSEQVTELVEEAGPILGQPWYELRQIIKRHLSGARLMVVSGSVPAGAPADFYAWCVERAAGQHVNTIVDASGGPLRSALAARPLLVKPNRAELATTLGAPVDSDTAVRGAIAQLNARWVVVTEGKRGAVLSNTQNFWRLRPPQVRANNPIGSGDSLAAGIAVGLVRGMEMLDACRLGIACGAANAMTPRAGVVLPEDVAALLPKVEIESWG
jgi:tagatose 6-phosphate kinase